MIRAFDNFIIDDIKEEYNKIDVFAGTFSPENKIELISITIELAKEIDNNFHPYEYYNLKIKPKEKSYYDSYARDERGREITKEILIDLVRQIHSYEISFNEFVKYYTDKYSSKYDVTLSFRNIQNYY